MTYHELLVRISQMTPEQQGQDVTVFVQGVNEFYSLMPSHPLAFVDQAAIAPGAGESALDDGHPYLVI